MPSEPNAIHAPHDPELYVRHRPPARSSLPQNAVDSDGATYSVLSLQRTQQHADTRPYIRGPPDLYDLIYPFVKDADREHVYGVYLNPQHRVISVELVHLGSLTASVIHPREIYKPALQHSAHALAVAHNHPGANAEPSEDDLFFTRQLAHGGDFLGIRLLDSLIIGTDDYVSLKERRAFL